MTVLALGSIAMDRRSRGSAEARRLWLSHRRRAPPLDYSLTVVGDVLSKPTSLDTGDNGDGRGKDNCAHLGQEMPTTIARYRAMKAVRTISG